VRIINGPMILLDPIIEIGALADANGLQITPCSVLEPVCCVARQDCLPVRLDAVDDDPLRPAMPLEGLAQEPLGGREIAPLAEPELDCVAIAVDGAIEIPPLSTNFDLCFVDAPFARHWTVASIKLHQQERSIMHSPTVHSCIVDRDAALGHHILQVPQAEIVCQVPANAEQNHRSIEMPALEHCVLPHCGLDAVVEILKQTVCDKNPLESRLFRRLVRQVSGNA
jgi:hypothetical protein